MALVKRTVIGPNAEKKSAILYHDSPNEQETPNLARRSTLWAATALPIDNSIKGIGGTDVTIWEPTENGMIFRVLEIQPDSASCAGECKRSRVGIDHDVARTRVENATRNQGNPRTGEIVRGHREDEMSFSVRRVVTGHDNNGKAVVLIDEIKPSTSTRPGADAVDSWTTEGFPVNNDGSQDEGKRQTGTTLDNGTVFRIVRYDPGVSARNHRTNSIDYAVVMSGEIDMIGRKIKSWPSWKYSAMVTRRPTLIVIPTPALAHPAVMPRLRVMGR